MKNKNSLRSGVTVFGMVLTILGSHLALANQATSRQLNVYNCSLGVDGTSKSSDYYVLAKDELSAVENLISRLKNEGVIYINGDGSIGILKSATAMSATVYCGSK